MLQSHSVIFMFYFMSLLFFGIEAVTAVKNLHMEVGQSDRNSNKVFFQKQNQPSSTLSLFVPPSFPD